MPLPQDVIEAQQFGFSVCAGESTVDATQNDIFGEKDCYCENQSRATFYWWAVDVLARTPIEGDDDECCPKCVTDEFACDVIRTMSPGCITCGCGNPDDVPESCDIVPDITVYQALDADQQLVAPNVAGRTTLIISNANAVVNDWSAHIGEIATDDGAGVFTYSTPPVGTIVFSSANSTNYLTYLGGVGPYFPIIDGSQISTTLTLISQSPSISSTMSRTVVVEVSDDNVTWLPVYSGPEAPLATATVTYTLTFGYSPIYTRTTYFWGEYLGCSYQFTEGTIPPYVPPPCGILVYAITPESICITETWTISVDFTQVDGWTLGTVTPVVNGVAAAAQPISLATLTFGPYIMGDLVTLDFTSNLNIACDFTSPVQADPRVGVQDFTVLRAVDADEYAALNGDGNDYYIVSDLNGSLDPWAANVGSIWLGGTSTYQAVANLEIVYASNPGGALGFWQDDAGVPKQLFPQPTYTYNTVTLIAAVTLPPVAPFTQAWATLFMQALWTPIAGSPATIYNGPPGSFPLSGFAVPNTTTWGAVSGFAAYSDGCAVRVPALLDTFTPIGVPDPPQLGVLNGIPLTLAPQPNRQFLAGGLFTTWDPDGGGVQPVIFTNRYARFNADITLDTAYNAVVNKVSAAVPGFNDRVDKIIVQPDGKVLIAGRFSTFNDAPAGKIVRLNVDGTLDAAFMANVNAAGGFDGITVSDIGLESSGKIVCVGFFANYNGVAALRIARLNANGTRDLSFVGAFDGVSANKLEIAPDGSILVNDGTFANYTDAVNTVQVKDPAADRTLIRISSATGLLNGVVAQGTQFELSAPPTTNDFFVLPDGSIIHLGSFDTYAGAPFGRIIKLSPAGTPDPTFTTNSGAGYSSETLGGDVLPNGQLMIGSNSGATYPDSLGVPVNQLCLSRLNADGSLDTTWDIGPTGFSGSVYCVMVDTVGAVVVGGAFASFNGVPYSRLLRFP